MQRYMKTRIHQAWRTALGMPAQNIYYTLDLFPVCPKDCNGRWIHKKDLYYISCWNRKFSSQFIILSHRETNCTKNRKMRKAKLVLSKNVLIPPRSTHVEDSLKILLWIGIFVSEQITTISLLTGLNEIIR